MNHKKLINTRIKPMIDEMYKDAPSIFPATENIPLTFDLVDELEPGRDDNEYYGYYAFPYFAYYLSDEKYNMIKKKYSKYLREYDRDLVSFAAANYAPNSSWKKFFELKVDYVNFVKNNIKPDSNTHARFVEIAVDYYNKYKEREKAHQD